MKFIEENCKKTPTKNKINQKQKFEQPWGFVHPIFQVPAHISKGYQVIIFPPSQTALNQIRGLGPQGGKNETKKKKNEVQNHIWQSTEAHHLHLYRYAHSVSCAAPRLHLYTCFRLAS